MFPETERSTSLRLRIVSGYFETALARELSDPFRIGNTEKRLRPFRARALVFSLRHPETVGGDRRSLFKKSQNRYLQDRDRICVIASIILNYADAGLRCPK